MLACSVPLDGLAHQWAIESSSARAASDIDNVDVGMKAPGTVRRPCRQQENREVDLPVTSAGAPSSLAIGGWPGG